MTYIHIYILVHARRRGYPVIKDICIMIISISVMISSIILSIIIFISSSSSKDIVYKTDKEKRHNKNHRQITNNPYGYQMTPTGNISNNI